MKCLNPDLINERRFWRFFNDEAEKYNLVFRPYSVKENKNEGYSLQIYDLLNADGKGKKLYENSFFFDKEIEKEAEEAFSVCTVQPIKTFLL